MRGEDNPANDPDLARLILASREEFLRSGESVPGRWIIVDTAGQRLVLARDSSVLRVWPVSTAAAGLDARQDSGGTPPGLHVIADRIGEGMAPGTVFRSRRPTGRTWPDPAPPEGPEPDLILTRILTLEGRQEGRNRGPGCDSLERYIYIHGTNHEAQIGRPVSQGCIRMRNDHMIELFDRVDRGDPVVIV